MEQRAKGTVMKDLKVGMKIIKRNDDPNIVYEVTAIGKYRVLLDYGGNEVSRLICTLDYEEYKETEKWYKHEYLTVFDEGTEECFYRELNAITKQDWYTFSDAHNFVPINVDQPVSNPGGNDD